MRVYLDTNTLIEAIEGRTETSSTLASLLKSTRRTPAIFVTSELTVGEILVKPLQMGRRDLVEDYDALLRSGDLMDVVPISRQILTDGASIRARHPGVKLLDAIHLATAIATRCKFFLTNDRRLKSVDDVKMVGLSALELAVLTSALTGE